MRNILSILPEGVLIFNRDCSKLNFANKMSRALLFTNQRVGADVLMKMQKHCIDSDLTELGILRSDLSTSLPYLKIIE
jgi:hypothetical protein